MSYLAYKSKYNPRPKINITNPNSSIKVGYEDVIKTLKKNDLNGKTLVFEVYPQTDLNELLTCIIQPLSPDQIIDVNDAAVSTDVFEDMMKDYITDDRVFGYMSGHQITDFFDEAKLEAMKEDISIGKFNVVYGTGASLVTEGDILIYCDLARWEIQQRYRNGAANWLSDNASEDKLRKFKRGYFIEWRVADRLKIDLFDRVDYLLDTNLQGNPKLLEGSSYREGLDQVTRQPFRLVPYFDAGVWGGQWMKEVCHLDKDKVNFAWSFDGVPEENSLYLAYGNEYIEIPAINLVLSRPIELLGEDVYERFGAEFPIRFDFLDTMEGQNLSLQVHPITSYIKDQFDMTYTQDESYYILDAVEDAHVYLGMKEDADKNDMLTDLRAAERGEKTFEDERFINRFLAKKHDHFSIPAGTIHCSGAGSMVLEISATPYIFTFKLWDWDRVGLDGKPRPVYIDHGEKVIQYDRRTEWVKDNLVSPIEVISESQECREERTGLHSLEFIETRRHWFKDKVNHKTNGVFNMLNLVEGEEAIVESPTGAFEPYVVHYAETFIIPASVEAYTIRPYGDSVGKEIATIKAYVRSED